MTPYFNYELTAIQTSLFKDYAMHKTAKVQLAKALMSNVQPSECSTQIRHVALLFIELNGQKEQRTEK